MVENFETSQKWLKLPKWDYLGIQNADEKMYCALGNEQRWLHIKIQRLKNFYEKGTKIYSDVWHHKNVIRKLQIQILIIKRHCKYFLYS